jgi:hypothetical protein
MFEVLDFTFSLLVQIPLMPSYSFYQLPLSRPIKGRTRHFSFPGRAAMKREAFLPPDVFRLQAEDQFLGRFDDWTVC